MADSLRRLGGTQAILGFLALAGGSMFAIVLLSRFGLKGVGLLVVLAAGIALLNRPGLIFAGFLFCSVVFQYRAEGLLGPTGVFFEPAMFITPMEAMAALLVVSVALDIRRKGRWREPAPFTIPLLLVALAMFGGIVVGKANHAETGEILNTTRGLVLFVVMPFVVANVITGPKEIRRMLLGLAGLTLFLAIIGLAAAAVGRGQGEFEGAHTTYYLPTPVWLMMIYLLTVFASALMKVRLPKWIVYPTPLVLLALALSYQRAFWLGTVVGLVVVLVVATGGVGRKLMVPAIAIVVIAGWASVAQKFVTPLQGPLADRVESIQPDKALNNVQDRYRIGERKNVWRDIKDSPLTGDGIGIPWKARSGLSVEHPGAREYTHVVAFWWWWKLGILGFVAYIVLMVLSIITGFRLRRTAQDPLMRVMSAAFVGAFVGLAIIETTASYTGLDPSFTVALSVVWGTMAVARQEAAEEEYESILHDEAEDEETDADGDGAAAKRPKRRVPAYV